MAKKKIPEETRKPLTTKGFEIKCEAGHLIGTFTCDKFYGDGLSNSDVVWTPGNETSIGDLPLPCSECGADWFQKFKREALFATVGSHSGPD